MIFHMINNWKQCTDTNISRELLTGAQNEKNLMDQKTNVPLFQTMDLADEMRRSSDSYLHIHASMLTNNSGNPESEESGLNYKFIQGSPLDDHTVEKFIIPAENQTPYDEVLLLLSILCLEITSKDSSLSFIPLKLSLRPDFSLENFIMELIVVVALTIFILKLSL